MLSEKQRARDRNTATGLNGHEMATLEELDERPVSLTRERVQVYPDEALAQLRRILKRHGVSSDGFSVAPCGLSTFILSDALWL
ncbi:MAG: hypothetical protein M5R42_04270 [Rhodocyclaceae bacterium]|nr:hypothetical protein [Rhodocyclaceae bacterium]